MNARRGVIRELLQSIIALRATIAMAVPLRPVRAFIFIQAFERYCGDNDIGFCPACAGHAAIADPADPRSLGVLTRLPRALPR